MHPAAAPLDFGAIVSAVQNNCHISDAQFARDLTLCTFLLKMRELYRWENDLSLSQDMSNAEVGNWMNEREHLWEAIEISAFEPLPLPAGTSDPFDVGMVNRQLLPHGLIYSGGYGRFRKPHFFLGMLLREEDRQGYKVYISACEYARDLDAPPGMMLDGAIFVRTEALRRWLWERYEEWLWNRRNEAMGRAVACYPFARDVEAALQSMTETETESVILHELGEARVGDELGESWNNLLAEVMRSRAEILARAVRDLYADCLSTLPGLMQRGDPAAIHFHFANFVGMRRQLFPELALAYRNWAETKSLAELDRVVSAGIPLWRGVAWEMLRTHARLGAAAGVEIEKRLAGLATA